MDIFGLINEDIKFINCSKGNIFYGNPVNPVKIVNKSKIKHKQKPHKLHDINNQIELKVNHIWFNS